MKQVLRNIAAAFFKFLFSSKSLIAFGNKIFDSASFKTKDFILLHVKHPPFNFDWYFTTLNNKRVWCTVDAKEILTWQFAVNYSWHDRGLTKLEFLLNKYYDKNKTYIDIGANIGARAVYYLSEERPSILFEPNKNVNEWSSKIIEKNRFKNYKIEQMGLSNEESSLTFYISTSSYMSSFDKSYSEPDGIVGELEIPVTTLDLYLEKNNNIIPAIVKIDVEGFELNVVKGALKSLEKFKPALVIEILDIGENRKQIIELLKQIGYKCFYLFSSEEKILREFTNYNDVQNHNYFFSADKQLDVFLAERNMMQ